MKTNIKYTVLVITSNTAVVAYGVKYFATQEQAQAYKPIGINCQVETIIFAGNLSEDQAITEYLE